MSAKSPFHYSNEKTDGKGKRKENDHPNLNFHVLLFLVQSAMGTVHIPYVAQVPVIQLPTKAIKRVWKVQGPSPSSGV
jgi:hypothetical protein